MDIIIRVNTEKTLKKRQHSMKKTSAKNVNVKEKNITKNVYSKGKKLVKKVNIKEKNVKKMSTLEKKC